MNLAWPAPTCAGAHEPIALLGPDAAGAGEHPRRSRSELSPGPPTIAVLPSADRATAGPCAALPTAPVPTSFGPCWPHTLPLRVNTHAAPADPSPFPPTIGVLPSADRATGGPCRGPPAKPLPISFGPCSKNCASAEWSGKTSAAPAIASRTINAAPVVQIDFR